MHWGVLASLVALLACKQPKQPLQPSFFTQKRPENAPLTCKETIDCYAQCQPLVEECMLRCDQRGTAFEVERARAVAYCSAQNGCTERACEEERCASPLEVCTAPPPAAAAPSPMRPQPYPGQQLPPPPQGDPRPPGPVAP